MVARCLWGPDSGHSGGSLPLSERTDRSASVSGIKKGMSLIDMIPHMSGFKKPSLILTPEDLAQVSGYSLRRINDIRTRTRIAEGQCGPEFFRPKGSKKGTRGIRVYYTVQAVRAWLTVKRPEKLPELDAWVAVRTSTIEV